VEFKNIKIQNFDSYGILDFEGRISVKSPFWFFRKVSEQPDKVAQKPDFWLRTSNNDLKQKDKS